MNRRQRAVQEPLHNQLEKQIDRIRIDIGRKNVRLRALVAQNKQADARKLRQRIQVQTQYINDLRREYMRVAPVKVEVQMFFNIQWVPTGATREDYVNKFIIFVPHGQDANRIATARAQAVWERIQQGYDAVVDHGDGNVAKALANIFQGKDAQRRIVPPHGMPNADYRIDVIRLRQDDPLRGYPDLIADAIEAPKLDGYVSLTGPYGCVVETIHHFCKKHPRMNRYTPEAILDELESQTNDYMKELKTYHDVDLDIDLNDDMTLEELGININDLPEPEPTTGFTIGTVLEWFKKHNKYFSTKIHFPLGAPLTSVSPPNSDHSNRVVLFYNNNHLYIPEDNTKIDDKVPLLTSIQGEIANVPKQLPTEFTRLPPVVYAPLDGAEKVERPGILDADLIKFIGENLGKPADVMINLNFDLLVDYLLNVGLMPQVECTDSGSIISVSVGSTKFVNSADYLKRKELFEAIRKKFPTQHEFQEFTGQSYAVIGMDLFKTLYGSVPTSFDSLYDREIINAHHTSPIVGGHTIPLLDIKYCKQIDMKKAYLNIMLEMEDVKLPVFHSRDCFTDFNWVDDTPINDGEYIVDSFRFNGIWVQKQIWNAYAVRQLLAMGAISRCKLISYRSPFATFPAKPFADFARHLMENFGSYKALYAAFIGGTGVRKTSRVEASLTTDEIMATIATTAPAGDFARAETETGKQRAISAADGTGRIATLIYTSNEKEILENINPVFRYVLGAASVKLLQLSVVVKQVHPNAKILATVLDSIYFEDTTTDSIDAEKVVFSEKVKELGLIPPQYDFKEANRLLKFNEEKLPMKMRVPDLLTHQWLFGEQSGLATRKSLRPATTRPSKRYYGPPGVGKSRQLAEVARMKIELTHLDSDDTDIGPAAPLCLANTHQVANDMRESLKKNGIKGIAMVFAKFKTAFHEAAKQKRFMAQFDRIIIDEFSMMDEEDWDLVNSLVYYYGLPLFQFGDPNQIPPVNSRTYKFSNPAVKYISGWDEYIKYDPNTNPRYDEEMNEILEEFQRTGKLPQKVLERVVPLDTALANLDDYNITYTRKGRDIVIEKKKPLFPDHNRYIITYNTTTYFNGDIVNKAKIDELNVAPTHYRSHIATTCHSAQGQTYDRNYTIYEAESFTKQMMYVALSRCRKLSQITIAFTPGKSLKDLGPNGPRVGKETQGEARSDIFSEGKFKASKANDLANVVYRDSYDEYVRDDSVRKAVGAIYFIDIDEEIPYKCYIGKTRQENLNKRVEDHVRKGIFPATVNHYAILVNIRPAKLKDVESPTSAATGASVGNRYTPIDLMNDHKLRTVEQKYIEKRKYEIQQPGNDFYGFILLNFQHNRSNNSIKVVQIYPVVADKLIEKNIDDTEDEKPYRIPPGQADEARKGEEAPVAYDVMKSDDPEFDKMNAFNARLCSFGKARVRKQNNKWVFSPGTKNNVNIRRVKLDDTIRAAVEYIREKHNAEFAKDEYP